LARDDKIDWSQAVVPSARCPDPTDRVKRGKRQLMCERGLPPVVMVLRNICVSSKIGVEGRGELTGSDCQNNELYGVYVGGAARVQLNLNKGIKNRRSDFKDARSVWTRLALIRIDRIDHP
jgi:hypothetical protein